MKILISDKISQTAIDFLQSHKIDFTYLPEISSEELLKIIPNYQALIVRSRTKVNHQIINCGKKLKIIGRVGSGIDNIDLESAKSKRIKIVNAPSANSEAVAELTICLMLALLRKMFDAFLSMKNGLWLKKELTGFELKGKTVGIVGYGNIGKRVEGLLKAFNARVLIYSRSFQTVSLDELFEKSDIVTLHLTLNSQTKGIINKNLLNKMKSSSFIINTSRGEIVDEEALYQALIKKQISGAALDVFWQEPLLPDSKWRKMDNVILTPHIGASTKEALDQASLIVVKDILSVLKGGKPLYEVI